MSSIIHHVGCLVTWDLYKVKYIIIIIIIISQVASEAYCLETYLYEYVVILNHQRADVDVSGEWVVPVSFCAHVSSACDILHTCQIGRYRKGKRFITTNVRILLIVHVDRAVYITYS